MESEDITSEVHGLSQAISETELRLIQEHVFSELSASLMDVLGEGIRISPHLKVGVRQYVCFRSVFGLLRRIQSWLRISVGSLGLKLRKPRVD